MLSDEALIHLSRSYVWVGECCEDGGVCLDAIRLCECAFVVMVVVDAYRFFDNFIQWDTPHMTCSAVQEAKECDARFCRWQAPTTVRD